MIAIAVDDEKLMLYALVKAIKASPDISAVAEFTSCSKALEWVGSNNPDVAFLDINMRGMGGLELAQRILEIRPDCKIIFCTGHEKYAVAAFKLRVSGYLMKPISAEDVQDEINHLKGVRAKEKPLTARCFGNFEVYNRGEKLSFKRTKTKELLAYLIDRRGAGATSKEICARLWNDDGDDEKKHNYLRQLLLDLRQTLEAAGCSEIFHQSNYSYYIDPERFDCDYFSYLETGNPEFLGEYMTQYSWAEETCGLLWKKSK